LIISGNSTGATAAIEGFQLDSTTGALTALPGSPFTTLPLVADCQFDQGGGAAFCIDSLFGTKFSVLTANPRVLVLDEPTSALDPAAAEEVLAALTRLVHDLGITVLVAEHRLERVVRVQRADAVMRQGFLREMPQVFRHDHITASDDGRRVSHHGD
jgi:hypothetical protein